MVIAKGTQDAATPRSATARLTSNILIWVCNDLFQYTTSNTLTFAKIPVNVVRPSSIPIVRNNGETAAISLGKNKNTTYLSSYVSQCQYSWSFERRHIYILLEYYQSIFLLKSVRLNTAIAALNLQLFIEKYWKIIQWLKYFIIMLFKTKDVLQSSWDVNKG